MSEQETQANKPEQTSRKSTAAKPATFKIRQDIKEKQVLEYRLLNKGGMLYVMNQSGITIQEDGKIREIRYCPAEPTIYRDQQHEKSKRSAVIFTDGKIFVTPDKPNLREFLDKHPGNRENGGTVFYLFDDSEVKKVSLDKEFEIHDAITAIRKKGLDDILSVATALNIDIDRPVDEIKHDLLVFAKSNPGRFLASFDNPVVQMKAKLKQAQKFHIITVTDKAVSWTDSGKLILSIPDGKDAMDMLVRYSLTESAAPFVAEIEKQLTV
jgi:hypothetical protein